MCSKIHRWASAARVSLVVVSLLVLTAPLLAGGVSVGEVDDFEGGTCEDWAEGGVSPNPPLPVPTGGPMGAGDAYCENVSAGGAGAGSRWVTFNRVQWAGNYTALGPEVTLSFDVASFPPVPMIAGSPDPELRLGFEGINGDRWVTTTGQTVPTDGVWRTFLFTLIDTDMTQVLGTDPIASALADVFEVRLISSSTAQWQGDAQIWRIGIDNVLIDSVPVELQSFSVD
ncbi:MAG: hypothetical protein AAGC60_18515 [Acidobacteriota bacterium]